MLESSRFRLVFEMHSIQIHGYLLLCFLCPGFLCLDSIRIGVGATCVADEPHPTSVRSVDYLEVIRPILHERCIACHGALKKEAGLRLDTAEKAFMGGDSGPAVIRQDVVASLLLQRVSSQDNEQRMPPEGEPLTEAQIDALRNWIQEGALYPSDEPSEPDPSEHWAFDPPVASRPPGSDARYANDHPIDAWLAWSRQRRGLEHQLPASKALWLRRVSIDLVGLPPSRNEIEEFEADDRIDAKERVVDRLLQSPQHGERWGRHWMDIWRYSDWWGLGEEVRNSQKHMWHWRDWIVESLNQDKGYDQMVREMLAADELYPDDLDRLRGTGFLARQYFKFNRTSWLDETVEHTAKAMLGLTFNCAKCHDHKYDPISHDDYYRFRAIFEPYQLRMDLLPGETDLSRDGLPRPFDCNLEVATYVHRRGDDRNPDTARVMLPAVPAFLGGSPFVIEPIDLPLQAYVPGVRAHVRDAWIQAAQARLKAAETVLTSLTDSDPKFVLAQLDVNRARAELDSIPVRYQADLLKHTQPDDPDTATAIAQAAAQDCRVELAEAEWHHASAVTAVDGATESNIEELKKKLAEAEQRLAKAREQVDAPGNRYRSLQGAAKTAESNVESEESRNKPYPSVSTGRRSALVHWMTDRSNPLLARVAVNHVWARHFGQPLVATVFDFGRKGTPSEHRELLDTLAVEFMDSGWSFKQLHRRMVLSKAYGMSSSTRGISEHTRASDPENRFYWRMQTGRMESQVVRDSLLKLSGELDGRIGGPTVASLDERSRRRSLYFFQSHNEHQKFLSMFDDANVLDCYRRARSIVPQQALALENSPLIQQSVDRIVAALVEGRSDLSDSDFARNAFESILGTPVKPEELRVGLEAMTRWRTAADERGAPADQHARTGLVRSLLNHNDFITIR